MPPPSLVQTAEAYVDGAEPRWSQQLKSIEREGPGDGSKLEERVAEHWKKASVEAV
jgi:hypothetical protein